MKRMAQVCCDNMLASCLHGLMQVLQWLDGQLDDAVSRLDFAVSHPTEEAYRMWQVLYKMKTVLESVGLTQSLCKCPSECAPR